MLRKTWTVLILLLVGLLPARAQFYQAGDDPGFLRWFSLETPYYRIIYPEGTDSLARVYGRRLEQFRVPVGNSLGVTPGARQRYKMPVVLHTHYAYSNGSVGWAPRRMDLYTRPEAYGSDPCAWINQLTAHEPRHQAQLQMAHHKHPWTQYLVGEAWAPVAWYTLLSRAVGEGDAVAAETGLATGTRARTADFLEYFDYAFDHRDWRSWNRWRLGSYKLYTPDLYKLGYMTVAGARYRYNAPMITREAWEMTLRKPWLIDGGGMRRVIKNYAGESRFYSAFRAIQQDFHDIWEADALARGPFMPMEPVTRPESYPVTYHLQFTIDDTTYALRDGYLRPTELVCIDYGHVTVLGSFASDVSSLLYSEVTNRAYWSETVGGGRWDLNGYSIIRYMDIDTCKPKDLTRKTRYYYPQPSPDGQRLAVVEYPVTGGSAVVELNADDGSVLERHPAPGGIQAVETAWMGSQIYATGLSDGGYGLYRILDSGTWETVLEPSPQKVLNLCSDADYLEWVSDRSGKNELYRYYPESGRLLQITASRYGATDYCSLEGRLIYVSLTKGGLQVFQTPEAALQPREVNYADVHRYPIEDRLTEQEQALGAAPDLTQPVPMSAPRRYYKWAHPLRFHSWLPLYANYDAIMEASFDFSYETAAPGLSAYFQNDLGTFSGMVGYGIHPSGADDSRWQNDLHLKAVWSGWYPVLEASLDLSDGGARQYLLQEFRQGVVSQMSVAARERKAPAATASLLAYVPLSSYKGGWVYGVTPQLHYVLSNNFLDIDPVIFQIPGFLQGIPTRYALTDAGTSRNMPMQFASASVRGYYMRERAHSQIYPSWGVGAESGISLRPGLTAWFRPNVYGYLYGYLPGLSRTQGLKLTAMIQRQLGQEKATRFTEMSSSILPEGFTSAATSQIPSLTQWKLTADYALPLYTGDIDLTPVVYIKRFVLTPHADYTGFKEGSLWSAGASLTADIGHFILPFDGSWGVNFCWKGGSWYANSGEEKPWTLSLVYSASL